MDDNLDLSGAFEKLQSMLSSEEGQNDLKALIGQFTGGDESVPPSQPGNAESAAEPYGGFDLSRPETMRKLQTVLSALQSQSDSSDARFLNALRPYLKETRRSKLDQAVKLLGLAKALRLMQETNGKGELL